MKYSLIAVSIVVALSGCSRGVPQGVGLSQLGSDAGPEGGALGVAAREAFGAPASDTPILVSVAGRAMIMNVVNVRGQDFAVFQEQGVSSSTGEQPNLSLEAEEAAQQFSGCAATGTTWTEQRSGVSSPKYAVLLNCS